MEDWFIGQGAVVWVRKPNFGSFCWSQLFICQVWLCCGLPEFLTFRYCTWLSNWLIDNDQEPIRKTVTCCCSSTLKPKINDSVEGSWCQHFFMVKSEYFYLHRGISPVNCKSVSVYTVRHPWIRCSMIYLTLSCSIISLTRHLYHRSSSG